jgi:hypothetical protein
MAETWLTTEEVGAWLDERRPGRGGKPRTANTTRAWLVRHYRGEIRARRKESGRGLQNLYEQGALEAALAGMIGQGGPGKPRAKRASRGDAPA